MNQKSTRKLLSYIMALIIAGCLAVGSISTIASSTVASKNFYIKHLVNGQLVNQIEEQLDSKYQTLSKKSGIPSAVFESVTTAYNTTEAVRQATSYLFDENDSTMYSDNKVEFFYNSCVEYLEANEIEYNEDSIMNVAKEATEIYSSVVGLHNMGGVNNFVVALKAKLVKIVSICVVFAIIFVVAMLFIYREKEKAMLYIGGGIIGSGLADLFVGLLLIITKVGGKYDLIPAVYNAVFASMTMKCIFYEMVAGLILIILGAIVFSFGVQTVKKKNARTQTRFYKIASKL